jgi:hypothetical protein
MLLKVKIIILITLLILLKSNLSGQYVEKPSVLCPQEKLEVHLSQESLFTGEILWFKIYCSSPVFPAEELSTLAFIEVVSS